MNRRTTNVDVFVFYACLLMAVFYLGFEVGRQSQPKVCATVTGMIPVSSTHDSCTYVTGTMGRAHWKMLAKREGKK